MTATAPFISLLSNIVDNRGRTCPTADRGLPLIATNCVKNTTLYPVLEKVRYVDQQTYSTWFRGHPLPGDLIFVCKGSPGQVCITPDPVNFCIAQDMVAVRADPTKIYPPYLFAALRSDEVQNAIVNMQVGTLIPHFKKGDFDKLEIPLPDERTQNFIGDMYLSLTEKIELNRRMNETLEGMAQAVFRDWFVDFGPVRRKVAGEADPVAIMGGLTPDPTRAAELTALFPAAFGGDGLPVGWSLRTVQSIMELAYGKSLPKTVRKDGPFPVYGSGGISGMHSVALVRGPGIIVGRKGTVGSLYWEASDFFAIDTVFYVVPKDGVSLNFVWHLLQTLGLEGMNTDAAVPGLNRGNAYRLEFACGSSRLLEAFEAFAGPLRARQNASNSETQTLVETRDYLLPRLMSGAVRVAPHVEVA
ncbi:type I restriction enzyme S subunit [Ochrobactrum sp. BH3]|nr:type I restriction enzyme S subunit [Ochrobactrum sp. BH3]